MRTRTRDALEALGVAFALPLLGRSRSRRHLVLAYHNVVPDGHPVGGEPSIHLPLSAFRQQMDLLAETHRLVPLETILGGEVAGTRERLASVTFDDAYRGALELALPELLARGIPATVFVAPGLLGAAAFWWDAVGGRSSTTIDDETREYALGALAGDADEIRAWARENARPFHESLEWERPGTCDELRQAAHHPLLTLGPHSWSHPNLTRVGPARLADEVDRPLAWLREHFAGCVVPIFAYPYGLSSRTVEGAVRRAGYEAALRVEGGLMPQRVDDSFAVPRVNVPAGLSANGFRLRAAGLLAR